MPTTEKLVTLKRLGTLLDAYGADPDRWPEQERAAALALIDSSSDARAMRDDALSLDSVLDFVEQPAISPALARRVQKLHRPARRNPLSAIFAGLIPWMHDRFRPAPRFAWQGAVAGCYRYRHRRRPFGIHFRAATNGSTGNGARAAGNGTFCRGILGHPCRQHGQRGLTGPDHCAGYGFFRTQPDRQ